eukprot:gene33359-42762_t
MSGHTLRAAQPAVHFQRGGLVKISGSEKTILEHGIVGAPAAAPSEGWWRYEVEVDFKGNDVEMYRAKEAREGYCLGFCVGWSSRDARQVCWNHVSQSLDEIKDQEDGAAWFQKLGLQLGTNDWSCGLRDSGEWGSPSGAAPRADDGSSKPDAAAHAPIDLKCTVAMLLDCDARKVYVSTGAKWVEHDVGDLGGRMFPAVSWMGCHGEVSFNFGE